MITHALQPVVYRSYSDQMVSLYLLNILSIPGVVQQVATMCPDSMSMLQGEAKDSI